VSTVLVNGRIDAQVKRDAEAVLASVRSTPSRAIRDLFEYIAREQRLPAYEVEAAQGAAHADRERRLALLETIAGISHSPAITSDDDAAALLDAELRRRHG